MKVLFLSDIHGVITNLEKMEQIIKRGQFDKIVVLGDLYYPAFNKVDYKEIDNFQVLEFLLRHRDKLICMRGNCDSDVDVKKTDIPILEGMSLLALGFTDIYLTHGNEYNYEKNQKFVGKQAVLVYGHFHIPYIKKEDSMIYICVGSISLPRAGSSASYLVYEENTFTLYTIEGQVLNSIKI